MKEYDTIIIGGGISGLYTAFKLRNKFPDKTFLILEKGDILGGRMNKYNFCGTNVNIGAGIGRKQKDGILTVLLDELGVAHHDFLVETKYSKTISCSLKITAALDILKRKYRERDDKDGDITFKKFAINVLGSDNYSCFVTQMGFSDFESESAKDVFRFYGMEDNLSGWTGMAIDWAKVISKISERIESKNIRLREEVSRLDIINSQRVIVYTTKKSYIAKHVVIASTIDTVRRLIPECNIYRGVHGQSFLRIYGKFGASIPNLKKTTIVPGHLKKISPIDVSNGIYMIAYTDNASADLLNEYSNNNVANRKILCDMILNSLGMDPSIELDLLAIKSFYWNIGTHYYSPLPKKYKNREDFVHHAQRPYENVFVVGEMISLHQGWTRGALESVEAVYREIN